jgi:hypothetical protein
MNQFGTTEPDRTRIEIGVFPAEIPELIPST